MFQRYITQLTMILFLWSCSCISIPDKTTVNNPSEECEANYHWAYVDMKEIQAENKHFQLTITLASLGVAFWTGPVGLLPLLALPYIQLEQKALVEQTKSEFEEKYCK